MRYGFCMPKRSRKPDFAQNALRIVEEATHTRIGDRSKKDRSRIMAEMGSIGGKIGGKRRAAGMTPEARRASASLAAKARWGKTDAIELKRQDGLRKIAQILEQHMTDMGLSEEEKNEKTSLLLMVVNETISAKLKAPAKSEKSADTAESRV